MNDFTLKVLTAPLGKTYLYSVGQAGFIIKSKSGQLLGIDMYLSDCVERVEGHMGYKRMLPKILGADELAFDVVITTHPHRDHFDCDAIPELMANGKTKLYASVECEKDVKRLEMSNDNVTYVKSGDIHMAGDFNLRFVNCDHGTGAPDAVGVIVQVDGKTIYEAGDTCLRLDRAPGIQAFSPIDVLIAPINGAYGNLSEEECAELSKALRPALTIPCHYGMFASHGGNPGKFYEIMKQTENRFNIMTMGEQIVI